MKSENFVEVFEESVKRNWDSIAIREYPGTCVSYSQMDATIKELQATWTSEGINRGDKIGICANNSIKWLIVYFSSVTNGNTVVLFPTNLDSAALAKFIIHSDCKVIYAQKQIVSELECTNSKIDCEIRNIDCVNWRNQHDLPCYARDEVHQKRVFNVNHICTILYTTGTSGSPKGVMLNIKNISNNIQCYYDHPFASKEVYHINTILPFFHIFGLINDAILPLCFGKELIISKLKNTPENIINIVRTFKPTYFFTLPLIVENLIHYLIGDKNYEFETNDKINEFDNNDKELRNIIIQSLGGNLEAFYTGGAPLSPELKKILKSLNLPLISGYGTSECGNLTIGTFSDKENSCGKIYSQNSVRVDSEDATNIPGEIQVKGDSVFCGYYKDNQSTKKAFTDDGWFKTGDLGVIDDDNILTITGRVKNMLLSSNGENIYPEDAEAKMNASAYIKESILVQRGEKLHAIVVADKEKANEDHLDADGLDKKIDEVVKEASKKLPGFTIISSYELRDEPLERTPKGSIKRYLYN